MKKISAMAVAITLLASSAALAQYNDNANRDRQVTGQQNRNDNQRDQNNYREQGRNDNQQGRNDVRDNPHWSRGDRLSSEYRDNRYVVSDWKNNHLRKPPRGYHWVHANNQYLLAAVASGVISDIILDSQRR